MYRTRTTYPPGNITNDMIYEFTGEGDIKVGQIIDLYKRGYKITGKKGNTLYMMSPEGTLVAFTLSAIAIAIVFYIISSLISYKVGQWAAKKVGWD